MRLLVDTDAFCKLGLAESLRDAALVLGAELHECARLPALPHMLRRGRLPKRFGSEVCERLLRLAEPLTLVPEPSVDWLDKFTPVDAIDPGEARIFAAAAEFGLMVLSDDKRALRAVKNVEGFSAALNGKISVLEAVLLALCERLGHDEVRRRVQPLAGLDKMIDVCFSPENADPRDGLRSYYRSISSDVAPLILWNPQSGDAE